jgi:NTP-dependent ternary system trypsin peptidase co-occuring protein
VDGKAGHEAEGSAIGLGETLEQLRGELISSMAASAQSPVRFRIDSVDLELQFTVTRSVGGSGGVQFWVVTASGNAARESSTAHTVTLHMSAVTADGGEILTNDELMQIPQ